MRTRPMNADQAYFAARALEEWQLSESATDPAVVSIHAALARGCESMTRSGGSNRFPRRRASGVQEAMRLAESMDPVESGAGAPVVTVR